jgi:AraC-like DNA-binding protein
MRHLDLVTAAALVPDPANYYAGTAPAQLSPPDNVLLFTRSSSDSLGPGRASHHRFVLIINCRAAGTVIVDTHSLRLQPGQALLVFPHQFHHYHDIEATTPLWMFVTFEHAQPSQLRSLRSMPIPIDDTIAHEASALAEAWSQRSRRALGDTEVALRTSLVLAYLLETVTHTSPAASAAPGTTIDLVHHFVSEHVSEPFTIAQMAHEVGLSESRLRAVYRSHTGLSIGRYVSALRLNRASGLLVRSRSSVKEIARECGYDSLFSFSRAFKREMRVSPREYRRTHGAAR